jgi:phosphoglycerate dehydrogenase-like enzyme
MPCKQKKLQGSHWMFSKMSRCPPDSALMGMDNVMLAPHNANSSPEAREKVHINTINNLLMVLNA